MKELSTAKGYICTQWSEAVLQLDAYLPLLASLIEFNHPVVVSYQDRLREFHKNPVAIESALSDWHGTEIGAIVFVYYFHVWVRGYLAMQWDSSTRITMVPEIFDDFVHFAMTSKVSHFPDPSDVPVLRRIVSHRVSATTPPAQNAPHQEPPSTSPELAQEQGNVKNLHFDKAAYQCGTVMRTNICKTLITLAFVKMKDKGGRCLRDDGKEMRHTFHLRENCASNCQFVHDHRKQSAAEADRLLAWVKQAFS